MTLSLEAEPLASQEENPEGEFSKIEENTELVQTRIFLQGGRWYYALNKENPEGYTAWFEETQNIVEKNKEVLEQARETHKEETGEYPDWGTSLPWIESEDPEKLVTQTPEKARESERNKLVNDAQRPAHLSEWTYVGDTAHEKPVYPKTPSELLATKISNYDFYSPDSKPRDTDTLVRGIGYAALQNKDIKVAAKALAFSDSVAQASPSMKQRLEKMLSQLSTEKQAEYVTAYYAELAARKNTKR